MFMQMGQDDSHIMYGCVAKIYALRMGDVRMCIYTHGRLCCYSHEVGRTKHTCHALQNDSVVGS